MNNVFSQVVTNEIIFENSNRIVVEFYNKTDSVAEIDAVTLKIDSAEFKADYQNLLVPSHSFSIAEFNITIPADSIKFLEVTTICASAASTEDYSGCILKGQSAGHFPDGEGDFIVYNNSEITPDSANVNPGLFVKKTSRTSFSPRDSSPNAALYYDDHYWIFGGYVNLTGTNLWESFANVWKSKDGLDWTLVNNSPPFSTYSSYVVFNNQMMVFWKDSVFMSTDGIAWEKHICNTFIGENYRFTVFKNKIYVISFDVMWESEDGINWSRTDTDFPWNQVRYLPALVSAGDRLFLYGGYGGHNDVWVSYDGEHWIKLLDHAPWQPRIWFNYTYFDNKIWMIAGNTQDLTDTIEFGNLRDFWYSSDGIVWKELGVDTTFYNRHASFLWNDGKRILISSGFGNNYISRMYNDVWELNAAISPSAPSVFNQSDLCINTDMPDISFSVKGSDTAIVAGLPKGVTGLYKSGNLTIGGKPEEAGIFNYKISLSGPFELPSDSGSLTVKPAPEFKLVSEKNTDSQELCINTDIRNIVYSVSDAYEVTASGLPDGVTESFENSVLSVSGRPSAAGNFKYMLMAAGECASVSAEGNLKVGTSPSINLVSDTLTSSQIIHVNTPLRNIIYSVSDASDISITNLPAGVTSTYIDQNLILSGMPKQLGSYNFTISAENNCSFKAIEGSIFVNNTVIFPNPSYGIIKMVNVSDFTLSVYDVSGRQIYRRIFKESYPVFEKDFSSVFKTDGIYIFVLRDNASGKEYTQKITFLAK